VSRNASDAETSTVAQTQREGGERHGMPAVGSLRKMSGGEEAPFRLKRVRAPPAIKEFVVSTRGNVYVICRRHAINVSGRIWLPQSAWCANALHAAGRQHQGGVGVPPRQPCVEEARCGGRGASVVAIRCRH